MNKEKAEPLPIIGGFIQYLLDRRHFSPYTGKCYQKDLEQFVEFLGVNVPAMENQMLIAADENRLKEFVERLFQMPYLNTTICRKVATLRSFYRWLDETGVRSPNPMIDIRVVSEPRNLPHAAPAADINRLLTAPDDTTLNGARDHSIFEVLYSTGIKVGELRRLDMSDVDLESGTLTIRGNNHRNRTVSLGQHAVMSLEHYIRLLNRHKKGHNQSNGLDSPLFINKFDLRLSSRSVRRRMTDYCKKVQLSGNITPQTLRHSFAINKLVSGTAPRDVQEILGYMNGSSTARYQKSIAESSRTQVKKAS